MKMSGNEKIFVESPEISHAISPQIQVVDAVATVLTQSPYRQLRALTCEANGEAFVLKGTVSKFYLKQIAQAIVLAELPATARLENRLEVRH
jgi:hypothetical protein